MQNLTINSNPERKILVKSALKFGLLCGGMLIFVAEAIAELEGKNQREGLLYLGIAFASGFLAGLLWYYLYFRNKHKI